MNDLIFDVPFWIPIVLALVGIAVAWNGSTQLKPKRRNIGFGMWMLAVVWFAVSYFVDTDKEKAIKGTERLVAMVVKGDWDGFSAELAPEVSLGAKDGNVVASDKETVVAFAKAGVIQIGLQGASVQSPEATQAGSHVTVAADIFTSQTMPGAPTLRSAFEIEWDDSPKGWVVREIRLVRIGETPAKDLEQALRNTK